MQSGIIIIIYSKWINDAEEESFPNNPGCFERKINDTIFDFL